MLQRITQTQLEGLKINEAVLNKINSEVKLVNILGEKKLTFIVHQLRNDGTFEERLLVGSMYGQILT